jgi:hypothetical protein
MSGTATMQAMGRTVDYGAQATRRRLSKIGLELLGEARETRPGVGGRSPSWSLPRAAVHFDAANVQSRAANSADPGREAARG